MQLKEEIKDVERKVEEDAKKAEKKLEEEAKIHPLMFFWDPVIIYFIAIIFISNMPYTPSPEKLILGFGISDKIKHVLLYFGFSLMLGMACRHSRFRLIKENNYFISLTASSVIGILDEVNQIWVPGRHMLADEIALNMAGCVFGQFARVLLRLEKKLLHKIF